jgi:hypothetical protein
MKIVLPATLLPMLLVGASLRADEFASLGLDGGLQPATAIAPAAPLEDEKYLTLDEFHAEFKKLSWTWGDFRITPYGYVCCSTVYETQKSVTGEYTLYVISPDTQAGDAFFIDAKSSRLGLDVAGPAVGWLADAKIGGRLELDFQGPFINANQGKVLFRQAYAEVKNEDYRLMAGQAWEVLSPLYPYMLLYVPGCGGGNLGYRRAQFRAERYLPLSDHLALTCQGSLNGNIISDFTGDPTIAGDHAGWPVLEGRAAMTFGQRSGPDALPITLGFSGHIGQQEFDFLPPDPNPVDDLVRRTWSANVDFSWPITRRLLFQCEAFMGENLGAYMGGVLQGIDRGTRRGIRSRGGWFDFGYHWTDKLHTHGGYSIDDPIDSDLTSGRKYNHFIFGNVIYDVTKTCMLGLEVSSWKTLWVDQRPGDSVRFEFLVKYGF